MEPQPFQQLYDTKTALIASLQLRNFAAALGYALVIKKSKETKSLVEM